MPQPTAHKTLPLHIICSPPPRHLHPRPLGRTIALAGADAAVPLRQRGDAVEGFSAECMRCRCGEAPTRPPPTETATSPYTLPPVPDDARRACVQRAVYDAFGYDLIPSFFVPGCDHRALWDFEQWAAETGCGKEPVHGSLRVHTAWSGDFSIILPELLALVDSFLATQDTNRARFTLWLLDGDPAAAPAALRAYASEFPGQVELLRADLHELARGTPLEGQGQFLDAPNSLGWKQKGGNTLGPKEHADMARLLILHAHVRLPASRGCCRPL